MVLSDAWQRRCTRWNWQLSGWNTGGVLPRRWLYCLLGPSLPARVVRYPHWTVWTDWSVYKFVQGKIHGMHPGTDTQGLDGRAVCHIQISDWSSCRQQASSSWLWDLRCQPCSWILPKSSNVTAQYFLIYGSPKPKRDHGWSSACDLPCYWINPSGQVHLPGPALHWQGEHKVEPEMALSWSSSKGSHVPTKQGDSPPSKVREMWYVDRAQSPFTDGTSKPNTARMDGTRKRNMQPLRPLGSPLHSCLRHTETSLRGWKCSSIWVGCWHLTTTIPRLCEEIWKRWARAELKKPRRILYLGCTSYGRQNAH